MFVCMFIWGRQRAAHKIPAFFLHRRIDEQLADVAGDHVNVRELASTASARVTEKATLEIQKEPLERLDLSIRQVIDMNFFNS